MVNKEQKANQDDKARQRIISYSSRLFFERGFRKVSIEELCAGMGISKRTFYQHFRNRDDLVESIIAETIIPSFQIVIENLASDKPVHIILREHFRLLQDELFSKLFLPFMSDVQTLMPELWANVETSRAYAVDMVIQLLERGKKEGVIRPDINTEAVSKILQRIVVSIADPTFVLSVGLSMQDLAMTMKEIVLKGVLVPGILEE